MNENYIIILPRSHKIQKLFHKRFSKPTVIYMLADKKGTNVRSQYYSVTQLEIPKCGQYLDSI